MCSKWGNNAKRFCDEGAVKPMVEYLGSHDIIVQRSAMRALEQLGKNPESCIIMHRSGVVKVTSLFRKYHDFSLAESNIYKAHAFSDRYGLRQSKGLKRVQTDLNTGSKRRNTAFKLVLQNNLNFSVALFTVALPRTIA